jgi:hypothetical protein
MNDLRPQRLYSHGSGTAARSFVPPIPGDDGPNSDGRKAIYKEAEPPGKFTGLASPMLHEQNGLVQQIMALTLRSLRSMPSLGLGGIMCLLLNRDE